MNSAEPLSRNDFDVYLAEILSTERDAAAQLRNDSLLLLELVSAVESLGVSLSDSAISDIENLDDLYFYYVQATGTEAPLRSMSGPSALTGRRVELRPVLSSDSEMLYLLCQHPEVAPWFRFRGTTPSPDRFRNTLWDRVAIQLVVTRLGDPRPLGLLTTFNVDYRNGHGELAAVVAPVLSRVWSAEALALFIAYVFLMLPLRKLYGEMLSPVAERLGLDRLALFRLEGCKIDHEFVDGKWVDLELVSIYRDEWLELRGRGEFRSLFSGGGPSAIAGWPSSHRRANLDRRDDGRV